MKYKIKASHCDVYSSSSDLDARNGMGIEVLFAVFLLCVYRGDLGKLPRTKVRVKLIPHGVGMCGSGACILIGNLAYNY